MPMSTGPRDSGFSAAKKLRIVPSAVTSSNTAGFFNQDFHFTSGLLGAKRSRVL